VAALLPLPFLVWGGEWEEKKKAKLVGWDKDSLTEPERQRKRTVTTILLMRRIYKTKGKHRATLSHYQMPRVLPSCD